MASPSSFPTASGPGSVTGVPNLPPSFPSTFTSHLILCTPSPSPLTLHAVIGGHGPPLLLLCGWPQTWYAFRHLMPALASHFTIIAPDPRGVGLSTIPLTGYDLRTLAQDMVHLMSTLGHRRFAMVGHDIGMWVAYALAVDHPAVLTRLVVMEATIPGLAPSPPLFYPGAMGERLWHFAFNRLEGVNERLVEGREEIYFGHQFRTKAARPDGIETQAVAEYVRALKREGALKASFEYYRAIDEDMAQNEERRKQGKIAVPVLAVGGGKNIRDGAAKLMQTVADDVTSVVIEDAGHYPAEETPEEVLKELMAFLRVEAEEGKSN